MSQPVSTPLETAFNHLERFSRPLNNQDEYHQTTQYFLHGGWREVINQYFYESPNRSDGNAFSPTLIFPGEELAAPRIEPIPTIYSNGLTIGNLVLKTAWVRDLSPRLLYFYPEGPSGRHETLVKFVKKRDPHPTNTSTPPSIETLNHTLMRPDSNFLPIHTSKGPGQILRKLIEEITDKGAPFHYFKGSILISRELNNLYVRLHLDTKSFAEILDAITYYLDATWDWIDEKRIYITPACHLFRSRRG